MPRSIVAVALTVALLLGACAGHRGEQAGRDLTRSLPAATSAIDGYLGWLRAQQRELVGSCTAADRPRDCARAKLATFRATQAPVVKALRAVAQPGLDAVSALLDADGASPVSASPAPTPARIAAPGEPCTPLTAPREIRPGEAVCPVAAPAAALPLAAQPGGPR